MSPEPIIFVTVRSCTNSLGLHAREDDIEHLSEGSLGCGLVDEVAAGQVDVVTGPDGEQHRALVDLYVRGGHCCQQSLDRRHRKKTLADRMC